MRLTKNTVNHDNIHNDDNDDNISSPELNKVRSKEPKNIFFRHLDVNPIRDKFESVKVAFDIFIIIEAEIDFSFPNAQFSIPEY